MNVALVGAGGAARHHAAAIAGLPKVRVTAVCDPQADRARAFGSSLGAPVRTLEELLDDEAVDVLALCTPPGGRTPMALRALAAGKAVVVEKPVAFDEAELDRLLAAGRAAQRPVAAMLQHRGRLPAAARALEWSAHASATVEVFRRRPPAHFHGSWRNDASIAGGGMLPHLAVHYLDLACVLLGTPREVWATMDFDEGDGIDTRGAIVVRFDGGPLLSAHASIHPQGKSTRLQIRDGSRTLTIDESRTRWRLDGSRGEHRAAPTPLLRGEVYREVDAALAGEPLGISDVELCRPVTKLLEAIFETACLSR